VFTSICLAILSIVIGAGHCCCEGLKVTNHVESTTKVNCIRGDHSHASDLWIAMMFLPHTFLVCRLFLYTFCDSLMNTTHALVYFFIAIIFWYYAYVFILILICIRENLTRDIMPMPTGLSSNVVICAKFAVNGNLAFFIHINVCLQWTIFVDGPFGRGCCLISLHWCWSCCWLEELWIEDAK
jgi:hypothetical protein